MNRLKERLRTALQDPRTGWLKSLPGSLETERMNLRAEVAALRRDNLALRAEAQFRERIIREQRELLRQAKPCPACVAKGE